VHVPAPVLLRERRHWLVVIYPVLGGAFAITEPFFPLLCYHAFLEKDCHREEGPRQILTRAPDAKLFMGPGGKCGAP
jgi:hypothetical protein